MKFPISTFDLDVESRWNAIFEFAESMYGISRPEIDEKPIELPGSRSAPASFGKWAAFSTSVKEDAGFHFFDFRPTYDEELGIYLVANLNEFGKWGVSSSDINQGDPPVDAYQYVSSKQKFVRRKTSCVHSLTHWVLELLIEHASISHIGAPLSSPTKFVKELRTHFSVSDRIGNIFIAGGKDWYATIGCGASPFGSGKFVILRYKDTADVSEIPKLLVDTVGLKPKHLLSSITNSQSQTSM